MSDPIRPSALLLPVSVAAVFTSATLLFLVQPMVGKMMLPAFGGAAAVWNTCLVFYQGVLLMGYLYAHGSTRLLSLPAQKALHLVLIAGVFTVLPIALPTPGPDAGTEPVSAVIASLSRSVGLPFFALAGTGPLLQSWFARTGHVQAKDPYFLYAASNAGSFLALLAYPAAVEPYVGLHEQTRWWATLFGFLLLLIVACGWFCNASPAAIVMEGGGGTEPAPSKLRWLAYAFIPSSLMMGTTLHLTTDIAAVPLLWVVPLALYLLAYILAFAGTGLRLVRLLEPVTVAATFVWLFLQVTGLHCPMRQALALCLGLLFMYSWIYHGKLAELRPPAAQLTEFYLWVSLGGVLGGMFNVLLAPRIFDTAAEFPLVLILGLSLLPLLGDRPRRAASVAQLPVAALVAALSYGLIRRGLLWNVQFGRLGDLLGCSDRLLAVLASYALALLACAVLWGTGRRLAFVLASAFVLWLAVDDVGIGRHIVERSRNFYGVLSVQDDADGRYRHLVDGITPHGRQCLLPKWRRVPMGFFHRTSPIADVFLEFSGPRKKADVAIVGLGAGTLAAYGEKGQTITYYELNPAVARVAKNDHLFTYVADSQANIQIVLGDARLRLQEAPAHRYGILVIDAFSSDAIPVHLLTRQAFALYTEKLESGGILAVHITNRYVNLAGVVGRLAQDAGLTARIQSVKLRDGYAGFIATWVIMAKNPADFGSLVKSKWWKPIEIPSSTQLWTDDSSNLLRVFQWE